MFIKQPIILRKFVLERFIEVDRSSIACNFHAVHVSLIVHQRERFLVALLWKLIEFVTWLSN